MKKWLTSKNLSWLWYAAFVSAIVTPWFLKPGYLFFTDFVWGPHAPMHWWSNGLPAVLLMKVLGLILPADFAQKIFLAATLVLVLFGGTRLAESVIEDRKLARLVGLFFLFNPFVYDRLGYGQVYMLAGLGLFCLGAAELMGHLLRERGTRAIVRAGLWFGLAVEFSPHFLFFTLALGAVWLIAEWPRPEFWKKGTAIALGLAALVFLAINAHWLIGNASGSGQPPAIGRADLEAFRTSGKDAGGALGNVLMLSGFWGKDQLRYQDLTGFRQNWGRSFFLLLPLFLWGAYAGLRDEKRRDLTIGLLAVFALSAFLAVGVRMPGARGLTYWLFDHVPFYKGLRETQKWAMLEAVVYGILLAWGAEKLFKTKIFQDNRPTASVFFAAVIVMQAPLMLWGLNGTVRPVPYPADWAEADALMSKGGCQGRILFLPWHMYMGFKWNRAVSANPAVDYFSCPVQAGTDMEWGGIYDNSASPDGAKVDAWLRSRGGNGFLGENPLGLRYVLLSKDADWQDYGWIDSATGLKEVKETMMLKLYEVQKE